MKAHFTFKFLFVLTLLFFAVNIVSAQNNIGNTYKIVKNKRDKLKDIKQDISPDENQQTNNTPSDTTNKTNPKTKNNLAVGDEGVTEDKQDNNGKNKKTDQVKGLVKGNGNTGGTKNNLAVGDQGVTEDQKNQVTPK